MSVTTAQPPMVFSIRAVYARRILDGSKRWEFRTRMPRVDMGDLALIYESRGRGRIVGAFTVGSLIHPMSIVSTVRQRPPGLPGGHGISVADYAAYFDGRPAVAIGVEDPIPLDWPLPDGMAPPQSWARYEGEWPRDAGDWPTPTQTKDGANS